jgi:hypothetical protein
MSIVAKLNNTGHLKMYNNGRTQSARERERERERARERERWFT